MRRSILLFCAILILAHVLPLYAGDRLAIGVKAGTLGLGVDLTGRLTDRFSIRGSVNSADVSRSRDVSDIDYDGTLTLGAYGVLLDLHPFKGSFRLSAGLMHNRTGIDLTATPTSDTTIGGTTYTPAEIGTLSGSLDFKSSVPYFGIGFGNAAKGSGRVRLILDLGVLSQGSGDATLSSSTGMIPQADLKQEERDVEETIRDYKLWPVVALGISFRI